MCLCVCVCVHVFASVGVCVCACVRACLYGCASVYVCLLGFVFCSKSDMSLNTPPLPPSPSAIVKFHEQALKVSDLFFVKCAKFTNLPKIQEGFAHSADPLKDECGSSHAVVWDILWCCICTVGRSRKLSMAGRTYHAQSRFWHLLALHVELRQRQDGPQGARFQKVTYLPPRFRKVPLHEQHVYHNCNFGANPRISPLWPEGACRKAVAARITKTCNVMSKLLRECAQVCQS